MPYRLQRSTQGRKHPVWYVVNEQGKRVHARPHRTRGSALAHLKAMHANVPDAKFSQSFTPPKSVQQAAKQALDVRQTKPPSQRGMTPVGLARARDLANGRPVSLQTVKRMKRYFDRHEVDKLGSTWKDRGRGWQSHRGWGGDEGKRWVRRILRKNNPS